MSEAALAGIVVTELGTRVGAGVCGSLLRQLGATVVLIERRTAPTDGSGVDSLRRQLSGPTKPLDHSAEAVTCARSHAPGPSIEQWPADYLLT